MATSENENLESKIHLVIRKNINRDSNARLMKCHNMIYSAQINQLMLYNRRSEVH